MSDEIISLAIILNNNDVIPKTSLMRNSIYYSFVSYINHTIALFISENYSNVALFIMRARRELKRLRSRGDGKEEYFTLCEKYLLILSEHLIHNNLLSDDAIDYFLTEVRQDSSTHSNV